MPAVNPPDTVSRLAFYGRTERPWTNHLLNAGLIIGHTTDTAAKIWLHTEAEGEHFLLVSETDIPATAVVRRSKSKVTVEDGKGGALPGIAVHAVTVGAQTRRTAVHTLTGLKPGTRYCLGVAASKGEASPLTLGQDGRHGFRTLESNPKCLTFGFYSCHMPFDAGDIKRMSMWERLGELVEERRLAFLIGGGDQAYTDGDDSVSIWKYLKKHASEVAALPAQKRHEVMVSWYREIYRGYWGFERLRRVFANVPQYMIWDDHEIMDGWGSYTKEELSNQLDTWLTQEDKKRNLMLARDMFQAACQVYEEYQHCHNPDTSPNVYDYAFAQGAAHFYVLDMRRNRDYADKKTDYRILGEAQFKRFTAWLQSLEGLGKDKVKALFVTSPVPVVHLRDWVVNQADLPWLGMADDLRDEWDHDSNYTERNLFLDALFETSERLGVPVCILSGDVHVGAAFRLRSRKFTKATLYQLTSSAITYCKVPKALKLLVRRGDSFMEGRGDKPGNAVVIESCQGQLMVSNNFCVVQCDMEQEKAVIRWNLYGNSNDDEMLTRGPTLEIR